MDETADRKQETKKEKKTEQHDKPKVRGVQVCQNCYTTWNRDVNSALNILQVFFYTNSHQGHRPTPFERETSRKGVDHPHGNDNEQGHTLCKPSTTRFLS